jgi:hypothetical protein
MSALPTIGSQNETEEMRSMLSVAKFHRSKCWCTAAAAFLTSQLMHGSALLAQDLPLDEPNWPEYSTAYSRPLFECVIDRRGEGADISLCAGLVEELCVSDTISSLPRAVCILEEQFAWTDLLRATLPEVIGVADGKTQISAEDYTAELNKRFVELREICFSFARDQIEEANRCQVGAAIKDVAWHFDLYDLGG